MYSVLHGILIIISGCGSTYLHWFSLTQTLFLEVTFYQLMILGVPQESKHHLEEMRYLNKIINHTDNAEVLRLLGHWFHAHAHYYNVCVCTSVQYKRNNFIPFPKNPGMWVSWLTTQLLYRGTSIAKKGWRDLDKLPHFHHWNLKYNNYTVV